MSAFLGPIHTWLFHKITLQNQLTERILQLVKEEDYGIELSSCLDRRYGQLESGTLEDIVDESNIHGWLQSRITIVENRLAAAVTMILEHQPEMLDQLMQCARSFGQEQQPGQKLKPEEMYQYLDGILLNGMPCDHVNVLKENTDKKLVWEQTAEIHEKYWSLIKGDVENYYDLRNAWIEGIVQGSGIVYAETAANQYQLQAA